MYPRERLTKIINHKAVDRIAWSPFIENYFLIAKERELKRNNLIEVAKNFDIDFIGRNMTSAYNIKTPNVTTSTFIDGKKINNDYEEHNWQAEVFNIFSLRKYHSNSIKYIEKKFETPIGTLVAKYRNTATSKTVFQTEFPIKNFKDLKIFKYMYEDINYFSNYNSFLAEKLEIGNYGLLTAGCPGSPVIELIEEFMGIEKFYYFLQDYPNELKEILETMYKKDIEAVKIIAKSPADFAIIWEDTGTSLYSVKIFKEIIAPILKKFSEILHNEGKSVALHSCGLLNDLIEIINDINIDILESVTPFPTGNITMVDLRKRLNKDTIILGGIDPNTIVSDNKDHLKAYVKELLLNMKPAGNFILANGDALPANTPIENLVLIHDLVEQYGYYK